MGSCVLSPKYDMDAYMANIFWRRGLGFVLRVGLSKKLDPTLDTNNANIFALNDQDPPLMIINHVLMLS